MALEPRANRMTVVLNALSNSNLHLLELASNGRAAASEVRDTNPGDVSVLCIADTVSSNMDTTKVTSTLRCASRTAPSVLG